MDIMDEYGTYLSFIHKRIVIKYVKKYHIMYACVSTVIDII
jgi:hypothetical protein